MSTTYVIQCFTFFLIMYKMNILYPCFLPNKWIQIWQHHITYSYATSTSTRQCTESISSPVNNLSLRGERILSGQSNNKLIDEENLYIILPGFIAYYLISLFSKNNTQLFVLYSNPTMVFSLWNNFFFKTTNKSWFWLGKVCKLNIFWITMCWAS